MPQWLAIQANALAKESLPPNRKNLLNPGLKNINPCKTYQTQNQQQYPRKKSARYEPDISACAAN
jgi:hypothetical protein